MKNQIVDKEERYIANVAPNEDDPVGNSLNVKIAGNLNSRGHLEVEVASQITPPLIADFYKLKNGWDVLTVTPTVGTRTITVDSVANATVGDGVIVSDYTSGRYMFSHVTEVNGLVVTLNRLIDFPYVAGSDVAFVTHDMNVNGSVTPQIYGIRAAENPANPVPSVSIDLTRVLMTMVTTSLGDLADFGDISGGLTNGMLLRMKYADGTFYNILNIRTNADFARVAYDLSTYEATNPGTGVNGMKWRLTFGGEEKMGTVLRLGANEDLQWVVQDDLTSILEFVNIAEGALVAD